MNALKVFMILLLLMTTTAFSQQNPEYIEVKLLEKVLSDMFDTQKIYVCVYGSDKSEKIKKYSNKIVITDCQDAQIILTDRYIPENFKPVFALNDEVLRVIKNAIGGLYWKKGRPQLIFLEDRLNRFNIKLPPEYKGFMIESKNLTYQATKTQNSEVAKGP
jgi:hypothetical protein